VLLFLCLDFVWCQEEHRNAGGWSFVGPRFQNVVGVKVRPVLVAFAVMTPFIRTKMAE